MDDVSDLGEDGSNFPFSPAVRAHLDDVTDGTQVNGESDVIGDTGGSDAADGRSELFLFMEVKLINA